MAFHLPCRMHATFHCSCGLSDKIITILLLELFKCCVCIFFKLGLVIQSTYNLFHRVDQKHQTIMHPLLDWTYEHLDLIHKTL